MPNGTFRWLRIFPCFFFFFCHFKLWPEYGVLSEEVTENVAARIVLKLWRALDASSSGFCSPRRKKSQTLEREFNMINDFKRYVWEDVDKMSRGKHWSGGYPISPKERLWGSEFCILSEGFSDVCQPMRVLSKMEPRGHGCGLTERSLV